MGSDNMEHVIKQLKQVRTDAVLGKTDSDKCTYGNSITSCGIWARK